METTKYLIIGGGLAAAAAAEELVRADESAKGATVILTGEAELPYHRPPLSKGFLTGKESLKDILIQPESFYRENGIDIQFRTLARLIDPATKVCELELNRSIRFEKALIATGASPVRYEGPGRALEGIHHLRSIQDARRIRDAVRDCNDVVIVGGGFIGVELASVLVEKKIRTTIISRTSTVLDRLHNLAFSEFMGRYLERRGVRLVLNDEPAGLLGAGRVSGVQTKTGRKIACDAVVFGMGARPNTAVAEASRIRVENGVVVDEKLATSVPGIYAAGDVASYPDAVFGLRRRVDHWDNADSQGRTAGRNLAGEDETYDHVSMFFSDVFSLSYEVWGMPREGDQIIQRGEISDRSVFQWYVRDGVINGALLMGRPEGESQEVERIIRARLRVPGSEQYLKSLRHPLEELR